MSRSGGLNGCVRICCTYVSRSNGWTYAGFILYMLCGCPGSGSLSAYFSAVYAPVISEYVPMSARVRIVANMICSTFICVKSKYCKYINYFCLSFSISSFVSSRYFPC